MSHDTEEWCKIWRKNNFLFQKWQEFRELWSKYSKFSKICTLIGPFCAKYIKFDLKEYWGLIFHDTEETWHAKFEKTELWFRKWQEEFGNFPPEHLNVSKFGLLWDTFIQSRKTIITFIGEVCVMKMKNEAKLETELTCQFNNDMRKITNFDPSTWKYQKIVL